MENDPQPSEKRSEKDLTVNDCNAIANLICAEVLENYFKCTKRGDRIKLTELILDCWQREYDVRPYKNLVIHKKAFEERLHHRFRNEDMKVLLSFLEKRKIDNLELLYINLPFDCCTMNVFVDRLRGITWLSLVNVDIPIYLLKLLSDRVEELKIKLLRLTGNCLTNCHAQYLRCFVKYSKVLQYLDVGHCCLDEVRFATIADGVKNSQSLKGVDMSRLQLHSRVGAIDETKISLIISSLIWKRTLVEVHFKGCFLDCHCMEPLAEYIAKNPALLYLDLGSNKIGPKGVSTLLKSIKAGNRLVGLNLSYNQLGSHGGEIIGHCLPKTKIRFLDISYNAIGEEATHLILCTIKKYTPMRILNMAGNKFHSEGARILLREINAGVLFLETIDVNVTYDEEHEEFHVVPQSNLAMKYSDRYHRTANPSKWPKCFIKQWEPWEDTLKYNTDRRSVLVNAMFVGPIIINKFGEIITSFEIQKQTCNETLTVCNQ